MNTSFIIQSLSKYHSFPLNQETCDNECLATVTFWPFDNPTPILHGDLTRKSQRDEKRISDHDGNASLFLMMMTNFYKQSPSFSLDHKNKDDGGWLKIALSHNPFWKSLFWILAFTESRTLLDELDTELSFLYVEMEIWWRRRRILI